MGGNEAAKRLGIPDSSLWNWVRLYRAGKLEGKSGSNEPVKRSASELEAENTRLRRELANTKLDLEIVKLRRRILRNSHREVRLNRSAMRRFHGGSDVSTVECVAHGLLSMASPT